VIGNFLLVGSTNVSKNSESNFQEAIFVSNETMQLETAINFINNICINNIGEKALRLLCKIYNPAKASGGRKVTPTSNTFIVNLDDDIYTEEEELILKEEKAIAIKKVDTSKHYIHSFMWNFPNPIDIGSKIIQVYGSANKIFVYPIGTVCRIKSLKNGYCFIFIEVPRSPKHKNIKDFDKVIRLRLNRNGRVSQSIVNKINITLRTK